MCTRLKLEKLLNEHISDDRVALEIIELVNRYHDEGYEEGLSSSAENSNLVREEAEEEAYKKGFGDGLMSCYSNYHK